MISLMCGILWEKKKSQTQRNRERKSGAGELGGQGEAGERVQTCSHRKRIRSEELVCSAVIRADKLC